MVCVSASNSNHPTMSCAERSNNKSILHPVAGVYSSFISYALSVYLTCLHPIRNFRFFFLRFSAGVCVHICGALPHAFLLTNTDHRFSHKIYHVRFFFLLFFFDVLCFFGPFFAALRARNLSFAIWIMEWEFIYDWAVNDSSQYAIVISARMSQWLLSDVRRRLLLFVWYEMATMGNNIHCARGLYLSMVCDTVRQRFTHSQRIS